MFAMENQLRKIAVGVGLLATSSAAMAADKPNILAIFGDDVGYWNISAYNQGMMRYKTPNIDRIANEGALFTDHYGQQSCTAGRAAFITGEEPFRTGLLTIGMPGSNHGIPDWAPTIADLLKDQGYIEVAALAYMRGWNVDNTILVFEEAQNATPAQIKLLLTRIGFNSKFFLSGDLEQSDKFKDKTKSGLYDAKKRLEGVKGIGVFEFGNEDIVRNPIIGEILRRYD